MEKNTNASENDVLVIKNLIKDYKLANGEKFRALTDINLSFKNGELVSIVGESGSGKSTLMNIIGGLDSDYEGDILLNGKLLRDFGEKGLDEYRKSKIGFVFQSFNLIKHLSIVENVALPLTLSNVSKKERIKRAEDALIKVGLGNHLKKKSSQLSGGQQQRVAIARALVNDPEIILADEPTGALDSQTTEQILSLLKEIADSGKLVIMVTHSEKVASISSRVVGVGDGRILSDKNNENYVKIESKFKVKEKEENIQEKTNEEKSNEEVVNGKKKKKEKIKKTRLTTLSAFDMSLKNMKAHKVKNFLVSFGLSIGIMSVILMLCFTGGITSFINEQMSSYINPYVLQITKQSENSHMAAFASPAFTNDDILEIEDLIKNNKDLKTEKIFKIFDIQSMLGAPASVKIVVSSEGEEKEIPITYVETWNSSLAVENVVEGVVPEFSENELISNIVLDTITGKGLVGSEVKVIIQIPTTGESVVLPPLEFNAKVSGLIDNIPTEDNEKISNQFMGGTTSSLYVNYDALFYQAGKVPALDGVIPTNAMNIVSLNEDKKAIEDIKTQLHGIMKGDKAKYALGTTYEQMANMFNTMMDVIRTALLCISSISLLVSAIMIFVVLYISVSERTKEIGVMKSLGARRRDIKSIFSFEALLIGLFSAVIAIVLALVLGLILNAVIVSALGYSVVKFHVMYFISALLISVAISVLSGLYPASMASKLDPVVSLRK